MKQNLHFKNVMRSVLFGAAMVSAACTFTACDNEGMDPVATQESLKADSQNGSLISGQYIVVFKNNNMRMDANATYAQRVEMSREVGRGILADNGLQSVAIEQAYGKVLTGMAVKMTAQEAAELMKDPRVDYVEQDRVVTLGKPGGGGGGTQPTQSLPYGISRVGGGTMTSTGTAWIIDTGIDLDHPDLNVDVSRSRTFFTTGRDANSPDDGNGHGTHVSGTIAAINNNIGVIGISPGTQVVAVKVLDSRGSGAYSTVIAGVDYVGSSAKAGDVANMSLGGPISKALDDAILNAANSGVKFALAAGNESQDANNTSPAHINGNNIYTVSAIDAADKFAYFSNFGNPPVDYAAPGVNIQSTWKDGGYNTISGTSMASPHVAGLLLLGAIRADGSAINDPDGTPDPIAHH